MGEERGQRQRRVLWCVRLEYRLEAGAPGRTEAARLEKAVRAGEQGCAAGVQFEGGRALITVAVGADGYGDAVLTALDAVDGAAGAVPGLALGDVEHCGAGPARSLALALAAPRSA